MYAKFVRPFMSDQDAFVVESNHFRYNKQYAESHKDFVSLYPNHETCTHVFDGDISHIEEWPIEVIVAQGTDSLLIAPHCSMFLLNESGKTVDSVHCHAPGRVSTRIEKHQLVVARNQEAQKKKAVTLCEKCGKRPIADEIEIDGVPQALCDACIVTLTTRGLSPFRTEEDIDAFAAKTRTCECCKIAAATGELEVAGVLAALCSDCLVKERVKIAHKILDDELDVAGVVLASIRGDDRDAVTVETRTTNTEPTAATLRMSPLFADFKAIIRGETDAILYHAGPGGFPNQALPVAVDPRCVHCGSTDVGIVAAEKENPEASLVFCRGCLRVLLPKKSVEDPEPPDLTGRITAGPEPKLND